MTSPHIKRWGERTAMYIYIFYSRASKGISKTKHAERLEHACTQEKQIKKKKKVRDSGRWSMNSYLTGLKSPSNEMILNYYPN